MKCTGRDGPALVLCIREWPRGRRPLASGGADGMRGILASAGGCRKTRIILSWRSCWFCLAATSYSSSMLVRSSSLITETSDCEDASNEFKMNPSYNIDWRT
jgi:hypothetical protein